jgi:hypothetical protein
MATAKKKRPSEASPKKASASRSAGQPPPDQATLQMLDYLDKYSPETFAPQLANAGHNEMMIRRAVKAGLVEWDRGEPIMLTAKGERALKVSRQVSRQPAAAPAAPEAERQPAAEKVTPQATGTRQRPQGRATEATGKPAAPAARQSPAARHRPQGSQPLKPERRRAATAAAPANPLRDEGERRLRHYLNLRRQMREANRAWWVLRRDKATADESSHYFAKHVEPLYDRIKQAGIEWAKWNETIDARRLHDEVCDAVCVDDFYEIANFIDTHADGHVTQKGLEDEGFAYETIKAAERAGRIGRKATYGPFYPASKLAAQPATKPAPKSAPPAKPVQEATIPPPPGWIVGNVHARTAWQMNPGWRAEAIIATDHSREESKALLLKRASLFVRGEDTPAGHTAAKCKTCPHEEAVEQARQFGWPRIHCRQCGHDVWLTVSGEPALCTAAARK